MDITLENDLINFDKLLEESVQSVKINVDFDIKVFLQDQLQKNNQLLKLSERINSTLNSYRNHLKNIQTNLSSYIQDLNNLITSDNFIELDSRIVKINRLGASKIEKDDDQNSALNHAIEYRKSDICDLLQQNGKILNDTIVNITDSIDDFEFNINLDEVNMIIDDLDKRHSELVKFEEDFHQSELVQQQLRIEEEEKQRKNEEKRLMVEEEKRLAEQEKRRQQKEEEEGKYLSKFKMDDLDIKKYQLQWDVSPNVFHDTNLLCIISLKCHSINVDSIDHDDITVNICDSLKYSQQISYHLEVVSNIIFIQARDGIDSSIKKYLTWTITIPYQQIRNQGKEIICLIGRKNDDDIIQWAEIDDTQESACENSSNLRMVSIELVFKSFDDAINGYYATVVTRRKIDKILFDKRGTKEQSSVDNRVQLTVPPNAVKVPVKVNLSVNQIDSSLFSEMKQRCQEEMNNTSMNGLYSTSPIISITADYRRKLLKPVYIQIPIAQPITSSNTASSNSTSNSARPKSAMSNSSDLEMVIKVAVKRTDQVWRSDPNINFEFNANGDLVIVPLNIIHNIHCMAYRCKPDWSDENLNRANQYLEQLSNYKPVQFAIRQQHNLYPKKCIFIGCSPYRLRAALNLLAKDDYDNSGFVLLANNNSELNSEKDFNISKEYYVSERQEFQIEIKGNLRVIDPFIKRFAYHSNLINRFEMTLETIDKYAQQNKSTYRGTVVTKSVLTNTENDSTEKIFTQSDISCEFSVILPKSVIKSGRRNTQFNIEINDIINQIYLEFLAAELENDWYRLLGYLKLPEETIKRIDSDSNLNPKEKSMEALKKWVLNTHAYSNKISMLQKGFSYIRRDDLAKDLSQRVIKQ